MLKSAKTFVTNNLLFRLFNDDILGEGISPVVLRDGLPKGWYVACPDRDYGLQQKGIASERDD